MAERWFDIGNGYHAAWAVTPGRRVQAAAAKVRRANGSKMDHDAQVAAYKLATARVKALAVDNPLYNFTNAQTTLNLVEMVRQADGTKKPKNFHKSSKVFGIDENPLFTDGFLDYDNAEQEVESLADEARSFTITYTNQPNAGGNFSGNDCLFEALRVPEGKRKGLRAKAGLAPGVPVPVESLGVIADALKIGIRLVCNFSEITHTEHGTAFKLKNTCRHTLLLSSGHYTAITEEEGKAFGLLDRKKSAAGIVRVCHSRFMRGIESSRFLVTYRWQNVHGTKEERVLETYSESRGLQTFIGAEAFKESCILQNANKKGSISIFNAKDKDVKEVWETLRFVRPVMSEVLGIDPAESGSWTDYVQDTALQWADREVEHLPPAHQIFVLNAMRGGLMYALKSSSKSSSPKSPISTYTPAPGHAFYDVDVRSMYPSIWHGSTAMPVTAGHLGNASELLAAATSSMSAKDVPYGFYKLDGFVERCEPGPPRFPTQKQCNGYYSHWDIKAMIELGYAFTPTNAPATCLWWPKEETTTNLFTTVTSKWFEVRKRLDAKSTSSKLSSKQKDLIKGAAKSINLLFGNSLQRDRRWKAVKMGSCADELELEPHDQILGVVASEGVVKVKISDMRGAYKGWGPAQGLALICAGRSKINKLLDEAGRANVLVVQTDGFVFHAPEDADLKMKSLISTGKAGTLAMKAKGTKIELTHVNKWRLFGPDNVCVKTCGVH